MPPPNKSTITLNNIDSTIKSIHEGIYEKTGIQKNKYYLTYGMKTLEEENGKSLADYKIRKKA